MDGEAKQPAGIQQIADTLGISIGTVDRALHDRKGISPTTRERVLKLARKLEYSPNVAARNLKLNRRLRVGVFLPREIASFFDSVREGMRIAALEQTGSSIQLSFHSYPTLGQGDVEAMRKARWQDFDGLIVSPGDASRLAPIAQAAAESKTPLVFVATDAPRLPRLACVAVDAAVSGSIAADLLGRLMPRECTAAVFTGDLRIHDHAEKLKGFAASLSTLSPHLRLLPAVESHDSPQAAYQSALALLKSQKDLRAIYIATANGSAVLRAVEHLYKPGVIQVVTTDLFPELVDLMETGRVAASLHQRPLTQGRLAFSVISRFLMGDEQRRAPAKLVPHIVLRSNINLFLDAIPKV